MGRSNRKIWALSILLNAIWAIDTSSGWRLESVEPNIIRNGDWINLYGLNTDELITQQETDDDYDENYETVLWPGIKITFVQNDIDGLVSNEVECTSPYLTWTDEFFPLQESLRVPYGIKCQVQDPDRQAQGTFKVKMLIPSEAGATIDDRHFDTNDADWLTMDAYASDDLESDETSNISEISESGFDIYETDVFVTIQHDYESLDEMLLELRSTPADSIGSEETRKRRAAGTPTITRVVPNYGSPRGGQIITIVGNNLVSQVLDIGTQDTSAEDQGESYNIWFEMTGYSPVKCLLDRMLNLLAREVGDHNGIYCKTQQVPIQGDWRLKLQIDGPENPILDGGKFAFKRSHAATIEHLFNAPSAPAMDPKETFRQRAWWTEWNDVDQNNNGNEHEDLIFFRMNKNCLNPIDMEVWDILKDEQFVGSKDFSGDGKPAPERWNLYEGFRCSTDVQTFLQNGKRPRCDDYKVRYLCIDGVVDMQGRIYTKFFDRVESKLDNDANRLQMLPTLTAEDGLKMGECQLFLKEDDGLTELDLPRVKTSGNDGFIRCLANATEPGLYNITYNTQNQGDSMPHPRLYNHFANEDLTPFNFEVYPQVRSVYPQVGSIDGGTKVTITGTGFTTTFGAPERQTKVEIGGVECLIEKLTSTEIICQTQMTPELKNKVKEMDQVRVDREDRFTNIAENQDCPGNDLDQENLVPSLDECIRRCSRMHSCRAVAYVPYQANKCYYKNGSCSNRRVANGITIAWMDSDALTADKLTRKTKTCFYGNGENYEGDVSVTRYGDQCSSPCRNPNGAWSMPKCPTIETGERIDCAIARCEKAFGNFFTGSRGLLTDFRKRGSEDYIAISEQYTGLHVSDSTFVQKGNSVWLTGRANYDNYSARERFIFIAPQDGAYRFLVTVDDWQRLFWMKPDGTYEQLTYGKAWTQAIDNYEYRSWEQHSRTFNLKKGDEIPLMMVMEEGGGGDYVSVGVQYLGTGPDGADGTRFDERRNEDRYQELDDRYIREYAGWNFKSSSVKQKQRVFFGYDFDGILWTNQTEGDFPSERKLPPVFKLEYCNELGECRITENLVTHAWNKDQNELREADLDAKILKIFNPKCTYPDGQSPDDWKYKHYHTNFENDSIWPGKNWHKMDSGRMCGRKAFRMTQGVHLFHWNSLKGHMGNKAWKVYAKSALEKTSPHLCMGVKGSIGHMYVNIHAKNTDGRDIRGWQWMMSNGDNAAFAHLSPGGGYEWGYQCFNMQHVIDNWSANKNLNIDTSEDVTIWEIRIWSHDDYRYSEDPQLKQDVGTYILIDQMTFGDYGFSEPTLVRSKGEFNINGNILTGVSIDIDKNAHDVTGHHWVDISYSWINDLCDFAMPLPRVQPPTTPWINGHGDGPYDFTDAGEFNSGPTEVSTRPVALPDNDHYVKTSPTGFIHTKMDYFYSDNYHYKDNQPEAPSRMRLHAIVYDKQATDKPMKGTLTITKPEGYDERSGMETESIELDFPISAADLKVEMELAWPYLTRFSYKIEIKSGASCNAGYEYRITLHKYGNFPNFIANLELDYEVTGFTQSQRVYAEGGVYDWRIPGSMMAIPRDHPEVVVTVNKMRSGCERRGSDWVGGEACSFDFTEEATPEMTNIIISGQSSDGLQVAVNDIINFEVLMDLDEFSVTAENSQVQFYPVDGQPMNEEVFCEFTSLNEIDNSTMSVECKVGRISEGEYKLQFTHDLTGHSRSSDILTAVHGVSSTDKDTGSIYGGQEVTVSGFGFRPGYMLEVFNPARACKPITDRCSYSTCVCLTLSDDEMNELEQESEDDSEDGSEESDESEETEDTENSSDDNESSERKRRATSGSPTISSLSETKISVLGGTLLTIFGSNFGAEDSGNKITMYNPDGISEDFKFVSWSDTAVVVKTGGDFVQDSTTQRGTLAKGDYTLNVYNHQNGKSNTIGFSVGLEVHSVSPQKSSVQGGLMLTIDGFGFATDSRTPEKALNAEFRVEVWADGIRCHVKVVTEDQIKCESGWGVNEHTIRSTGMDFPDAEIRVGESVRWEWSFTVDGKAPKIRFQRVDTADGEEASNDDDFWSEEMVEQTGDFTKMFTTKGTYFYTTGFVDGAFTTIIRGKIVVEDAKERAAELEILVSEVFASRQESLGFGGVNQAKEYTADHISSSRKRRANGCSITTNKSEQQLTSDDIPADKVYMIYSWASTPHWTSLQYEGVKPSMTASIELEGIQTSGDCSEDVIFSVGERLGSSSEFIRSHQFMKSDGSNNVNGEYTLDHEDNLDTNQDFYWFNVYVEGLGYAYYNNVNDDMKVHIPSFVSEISINGVAPAQVSTGGQVITIVGEGLTRVDHSTGVNFMGFGDAGYPYNCEIVTASYTSIVCELQRIIGPEIYEVGQVLPLRIQYSDVTEFAELQGEQRPEGAGIQINQEMTPVVNAITVSDNQVQFGGSNLDASNFVVSIKGETLINCVTSGDFVTCDRPDISAGNYLPEGKTTNGWVEFHVRAAFGVKANSISSNTGSRYGGQEITIDGNGFDENTLILLVKDGKSIRCAIHTVTPTRIVLYTPAVDSDGAAILTVSHNFVDTTYSQFDYTFNTVANGDFSYDGGDLTDISNGQSISLTNDGMSCSDITVEIALNGDPCGLNANPCDRHFGVCSVVDGKASCACRTNYIGDGYNCVYTTTYKESHSGADIKSACNDKNSDSNYVPVMPRVQAHIDWLMNKYDDKFFIGLEFVNNQYRWFDGVPAVSVDNVGEGPCFLFDPTNGQIESTDCSTESQSDLPCQKSDSMLCTIEENTYQGMMNVANDGKTCIPWQDVPAEYHDMSQWTLEQQIIKGIHQGNFCRNPSNDANKNVYCYTQGDNELKKAPCAVPMCVSMPTKMCKISPANKPNVVLGKQTGSSITMMTTEHDQLYFTAHYIKESAAHPGQFNIFRNSGGDGDPFFMENTAPQLSYYKGIESGSVRKMFVGSDNPEHLWYLELQENGNYRIRNGKYYARSLLFDEDRLVRGEFSDLSDPTEFEFIFDCFDESDHIASFESSVAVVASVTPSSCSAGTIEFNAPAIASGSYNIRLRTSNGYVPSSQFISFASEITSVSPATIGVYGGNVVTFSGVGFSDENTVTACETANADGYCDTDGSEFKCEDTNVSEDKTELSCEFGTLPEITGSLVVTMFSSDPSSGDEIRTVSSIGIDVSMSPKLTNVSPNRGGSAGGTRVTITGVNFSSNVGDLSVVIKGVPCPIKSASETEIICETDAYRGEKVPVIPQVFVKGAGYASAPADDESVTFWYIDRWSSQFTWGHCPQDEPDCDTRPVKGDIVVIPKGQVILLDESTPILAVLIVDGGRVIWDRAHGIHLQSEYVIVTNDGSFEIGTEDNLFCHEDGRSTPMEAYITLYGHQRSIRLPIYGAKVFAVRKGKLDFHGCRITTTWTEMDESSEIGDSTIRLTHPVADDWFAGDEVVIASTGDIHHLHHSEQRTIASVSSDGYEITFIEPLEYTHIAECTSGWDWADTLCYRAEVGLLTRNIKFRGNVNSEWTEDLPECELGIGTAFGTQTCFQNRFGHEVGSDQFGAHLFLHKIEYAKIQYVEFTHVGQAFNLGRYPIHFHVPGSVGEQSYIRGNAIYHGFNRACTLHGVHNLTVEYNVAYNIMGLTFFIEDGVEEDNILQYNLAIMTKKSSSLLNVDAIPSSFWITNANNIWRHNHVAGSTHFGYWFNAPTNPTGPSATNDICCRQRPLGEFWNNTVHSSGKYGLWVFIELSPTGPEGKCGETTPKAMKIGEIPEGQGDESTYGLFAWNCERGAEMTTGGAIQFHNFIGSDNWVAGISGKETFLNTYGLGDTMAFVRSIAIGRSMAHPELEKCGQMGIETPWEEFAFTVHDIHFFNYDEPGSGPCHAYDPCYGSDAFDCAADTWFTDVRWTNSKRKITTAWEHEYALRDIDGSFTETGVETYVVPKSDAYDKSHCYTTWPKTDGDDVITGGRGVQLCPYDNGIFKPHRFAFNNSPSGLKNLNTKVESEFGTAGSPFRVCRPLGKGWMFLLNQHQNHILSWDGMDHIMNYTYSTKMHDIGADEYLTISHKFPQRIDYAKFDNRLDQPIDPTNDTHTTYSYYISSEEEFIRDKEYEMTYILRGTSDPVMSESRGVYPKKYEVNSHGDGTHGRELSWQFKIYKCFWENCIKPTTTTQPATTTTTAPTLDCEFGDPDCDFENDFMSTEVDPITGQNNTNFFITDKRRVTMKKIDGGVLSVTRLSIDGELTIEPEEDITIELENLLMNTDLQMDLYGRKRRSIEERYSGILRIGTADNPVPCDRKVTIKLMGNVSEAEDFGALGNSIPVGAKTLGGYGSIEMHGCPRDHYYAYMETTVQPGAIQITLDRDVDWKVGEEIAIATSTFEHKETEFFMIDGKNGRELTLNTTIAFRKTGIDTVVDGSWNTDGLHMGSEVIILSRNIVIDGADGANGVLGGRILIASTIEKEGGKTFHRSGYGQFSNVEFRHMGQFGYQEMNDPRTAIAFYNVQGSPDAGSGRKQSYIKGCSIWGGYNHAIMTVEANDLIIEDNVIVNMVNSGIVLNSKNTNVRRNVIANLHEKTNHLENLGNPPGANTQFDFTLIANGIESFQSSNIIEDNIIAGVEGACFKGKGISCKGEPQCENTLISDDNTVLIGNKGHACLRGYEVFQTGAGTCTKVSKFFFHHIRSDAFYIQTPSQQVVISENRVADSQIGVYVHVAGPNAESKQYDADRSVTVKHNVFVGRTSHFDCSVDNVKVSFDSKSGPAILKKQGNIHTGIVISDFNSGFNKAPNKPYHKVSVKPPAIYGRTCSSSNIYMNYNGLCGSADAPVQVNPYCSDHCFPMYFVGGDEFINSGVNAPNGAARMMRTFRPAISLVNIADCHDLHCDGFKKVLIVDEDGSYLGYTGSYISEAEYEWDGVTRGGKTYSDTRDGLGDYRIPKTMLTELDGKRISVNDFAPHKGVHRDSTCEYDPDHLGWFCGKGNPDNDLTHFMMNYQFMDVDHMLRRITPLAVRSQDGYIDIINGPQDHSCCVGYACMIRLNSYHMTMGCNLYYDFHFSGTIPKKMNFHLPDYVKAGKWADNCKVYLNFYLGKPYRVDVQADGIFIPPTNARWVNNELEFERPRLEVHTPSLQGDNSAQGSNFFSRQEQSIHLIMQTGHIYSLTIKSTVILELEVMTELTEDEFYDNGNIAENIAALLGINPKKIKIMDVVRETNAERRKRREASGLYYYHPRGIGRERREDEEGTTLAFAIGTGKEPEQTDTAGEADDILESEEEVNELNEIGKNLAKISADESDPLGNSVKDGVLAQNPDAEIEVEKAVVGMAEKPKTEDDLPAWFDEDNPTGEDGTITAQFGIDESEIMGGDETCEADSEDECEDNVGVNMDLLKALVNEKSGGQVDLDEIETAEEKASKAQEALDKAAEPVEYKTPTTLSLIAEPTRFMIEKTAFFEPFEVVMLDQDGIKMDVVGFASDPSKVTIRLADGEVGTLSGDLTIAFPPADGVAEFSNIVVEGTDGTVAFEFTVSDEYPAIADIASNEVEVMPNNSGDECPTDEGSPFDLREVWDATCSKVCTSPCQDLGGLVETVPECINRDSDQCGLWAACGDSGCECDLDQVPHPTQLNPEDHMIYECDKNGMTVKINKCMMHKLGFTLSDLALNGVDMNYDGPLRISAHNSCRGRLDYQSGTDYIFQIHGSSDCGMEKEVSNGQITYKNAISGSKGINNGVITRKRKTFIQFECSFTTDIQASIGIGEVARENHEVVLDGKESTLDVSMALYTSSDYSTMASSEFQLKVPAEAYIGIEAVLPADYNVKLEKCWATPTNDPADAVAYTMIDSGCIVDSEVDYVDVITSGLTDKARFSFDSFIFGNDPEAKVFVHCDVYICDSISEDCTMNSCSSRRKRRDVNQTARLITQTVAFQVYDIVKVRQAAIERKMKNIFG